MNIVGIDLGGTNIKSGLVTEKGEILARGELPTNAAKGGKAVMEGILCAIDGHFRGGETAGIGIGSPGVFSTEGVMLGGCENLPGFEGTDVRGEVRRRFGDVAVATDNDATTAAMGEFLFGAARGRKHVVFITLGTGIGGGLILDGKVYRGSTLYAGEVGHVCLDPQGPPCNCGSLGCAEAYAGTVGFFHFAESATRRHPSSKLCAVPRGEWTVKGICDLAREGDPAASEAVGSVGFYTGVLLANLTNLFDPEVCIVGGGIAKAGEVLFAPIRSAVRRYALALHRERIEILPAALGNDAGILGAAAHVLIWSRESRNLR